MIEIRDVSRRYGAVQALDHVDLRVEGSGVIGILGQNGAGKTTLLNVLTGYLAPTEGSVLINGHDALLSPLEARRSIGYLPENPPLYEEMTVWEYLCFVSRLRGVEEKGVNAHVEEIMKLTGLSHMRNRLLANLSKGYRQRAGFAQALCGDADILVLDEPTVGLDPVQISEIRELIRLLGKEKTVLFSSHILSEVEQLCTRVIMLDHGRVCLDSESQSLSGQNRFRVEWRGDSGRMLGLLKLLPGFLRAEPLPASEGRSAASLIFTDQDEPEERIFACFSRAGVPLSCLFREKDSLETLFLKVVSGEQREGEPQ